jgi:hypothetical protein
VKILGNTIAAGENIDSIGKFPHPEGMLLYNNQWKHFSAVMQRMAVIDNAIMIISADADPSAKLKYMNLAYTAKNIVNSLLPGVVFADAEISTSRVIPILYHVFTEDYLKGAGYSSDFYTPWGLFFLIFGWWGGLFMLSIASLGVYFTYFIIMRFGGKFRYHMGALCLLSVSNLFFANMGMDHWIANSVIMLGSGAMALVLFESGEFIFNWIRSWARLRSRL